MRETTQKFIQLFFNSTETICVSHNEYGYHSITQNSLNDQITLLSPKNKTFQITEKDILLMAINPIDGFRRDENVTSYRSFMVELDEGTLAKQSKYIEKLKMPYSTCIFSGNKSLHYGIVLKEDLLNENIWKFYMQWILNIVTKADQVAKNPTRSIRFPENIRTNGKRLKQTLIHLGHRVDNNQFNIWLNQYPQCKPVIEKKVPKFNTLPTINNIPLWVMDILNNGIYNDRNINWFKIAIIFANKNFDIDSAIAILEDFFVEEKDFTKREWLTTIKSAFEHVNKD